MILVIQHKELIDKGRTKRYFRGQIPFYFLDEIRSLYGEI